MTDHQQTISPPAVWKKYELFLFRIAFIFFGTLSIPLSIRYYSTLFSLNWLNLNYRDITNMGRFSPSLININSESGRWGLASYIDYVVILLAAVLAASIWTLADRKRRNYNLMYYWLRTLVRYRIAIGMIEFGFVKVFLIQMPQAPLGTLHTRFGDITAQKLYWLSVGVVPWYEITVGMVEVIAGALLFFRKTVFPGALLTMAASANIVFINFAYDGGVHVYSSYFVLLASFLLIPYLGEYYRLLVKQENVIPKRYYPAFTTTGAKTARIVLKSGVMFLFLVMLSYLHIQNWKHQPFVKQPVTPGIRGSAGYYIVTEFSFNHRTIPYSPFDSLRWHDATFEEHSTLTFKSNKPIKLDLSNGVPQKRDVDRTWELTGIAGGRQFYFYEADEAKKTLKLFNKHSSGPAEGERRGANNRERNNRRGRNNSHSSRAERDGEKADPDYVFTYAGMGTNTITLDGYNSRKDKIHVVLEKVKTSYALKE